MQPTMNTISADWSESRIPVKRIDWTEYFILQAFFISTRSLDPQTQHGCVIVKPDKTIVSTGYNSFIGGIDDSVLPNLRPDKYPFMIHSEQNAILSAAKNGHSTEGCCAYITGPPCTDCFQYLHQAGIIKIRCYDGNKAHMTCNDEYDTNFEALQKLSHIDIKKIRFGPEFSDKIDRIKSCR